MCGSGGTMGGWSLAVVLVSALISPAHGENCGEQGNVCCREGARFGLDEKWSWEKDMRFSPNCEVCGVFLYWNIDMDINNPSAYAAVYACVRKGECKPHKNRYGIILREMRYYPYRHADWYYPKTKPEVGPVRDVSMQCCNSIEETSPKCEAKSKTSAERFKESIHRSWWASINFNPTVNFFPNGLYCTVGNVTYVDGQNIIEAKNLTTRTYCWYCITLDILDRSPATGNFTRRRLEFTCSKHDPCETFVKKLPKNDEMKIVDCKSCQGGITIRAGYEYYDRCNDRLIPGPTVTTTTPPPKLYKCTVGIHEYGKPDNRTKEPCVACGYRLSRNVSQPPNFMGAYLAEFFCINDTAVIVPEGRSIVCKRMSNEPELRPGYEVLVYHNISFRNCSDTLDYSVFMYNYPPVTKLPNGSKCFDSNNDWWFYDNVSNPKTMIDGCAACNIERMEEDRLPKARLKCVKSAEDFCESGCSVTTGRFGVCSNAAGRMDGCNKMLWNPTLNRPAGISLTECFSGNQFAITNERNRRVCSLAVHENGLAEYPHFDSYADCLAAQRNPEKGIDKLLCCWDPKDNDKRCRNITMKANIGPLRCSGSKEEKKCDACRTEKVEEPCLIGNATWHCNRYRKAGEAGYKCCFSDYCNGPPPKENEDEKKGSTGGTNDRSYVDPTQSPPSTHATLSHLAYYLQIFLAINLILTFFQ